ncbi:MAG: D,D-heptose 1,7-bisphosphate phosphatase [Parcubacteria group bacterium GW2011_GWA2_51_10]|nr:MAG: D,D-heptose 1,7-bisphosphate phosphatase [Parcubacteria group bacterium GW2011_GWA2_51_10]
MEIMRQAVILAGGQGTRLMPLTADKPKPLVEVAGRPFLEYLLELLKENGIERVLILTGHMGEMIENYFGNGAKYGLSITYHWSKSEAETGTRLRNARAILDDEFLLLYCDNYWPLKLDKLMQFRKEHGNAATAVVYTNKDNYSKNNMRVGEDGLIELYDKSRTAPDLNGIDVGFFILHKSALGLLPEGNQSFEKEVLPPLIEQKKLAGYFTDHRYYTIGSLERFEQAVEFLRPKKIAILDRDGVINKKPPKAEYVKKWSEFEFLPDAKEAIAGLTQKGYEIYLISNQAGIARGAMSESDLSDIHAKMLAEIEKSGGHVAGIYHCPHGWDEGCECRKPKPGMLFAAAREHHFDLTKAVFIGDDERDGSAAEAADCPFRMVDESHSLLSIARSLP